jgi:hypothetical protein
MEEEVCHKVSGVLQLSWQEVRGQAKQQQSLATRIYVLRVCRGENRMDLSMLKHLHRALDLVLE